VELQGSKTRQVQKLKEQHSSTLSSPLPSATSSSA
jgi:hypothetical protein